MASTAAARFNPSFDTLTIFGKLSIFDVFNKKNGMMPMFNLTQAIDQLTTKTAVILEEDAKAVIPLAALAVSAVAAIFVTPYAGLVTAAVCYYYRDIPRKINTLRDEVEELGSKVIKHIQGSPSPSGSETEATITLVRRLEPKIDNTSYAWNTPFSTSFEKKVVVAVLHSAGESADSAFCSAYEAGLKKLGPTVKKVSLIAPCFKDKPFDRLANSINAFVNTRFRSRFTEIRLVPPNYTT